MSTNLDRYFRLQTSVVLFPMGQLKFVRLPHLGNFLSVLYLLFLRVVFV